MSETEFDSFTCPPSSPSVATKSTLKRCGYTGDSLRAVVRYVFTRLMLGVCRGFAVNSGVEAVAGSTIPWPSTTMAGCE